MPLYLDSSSTNQKISKIYIDSSDSVQKVVKEAWLADEAGVNRKIFSMGIPIGQLPIGSVVKDINTKYNDAVIRFIVGYKDVNAVRLITERIITLKCFDAKEPTNPNSQRKSYGNNRYSQSNIDQWLNSTATAGTWYNARHEYDTPPASANVSSNYYDQQPGFLVGFSEPLKNILQDDTVVIALNTVSDGGGSETITRKVRLITRTEAGKGNENGIVEGAQWEYFKSYQNRQAFPTYEAAQQSEYSVSASQPWWWFLATPYIGRAGSVRFISENDDPISFKNAYDGSGGIRPAIFLSPTTLVFPKPDTDGAYMLQF
ncbi:DUF6273 domain-containing protein [Anaeromassilibacillus senegalensis]|uniref:DUF6273 domain-containing protein n=1 Tax=Anaeromassilibacillus senegalensis TaxID=1673717 RepID=UPI0006833022|nr:DUF6273 domain-containing protein [Anaeromassilibacillus senegalensis]